MTDERGEQAKPDLLSISVSAVSWLFVIGSFALVTAWVYFLVRTKDQLDTPGTLGQMGDFIGGSVNPVLSLMTLYALGLTVVMQARQLRLSREELVATRAELARAAEAQESAAKLMAEQLAAAKDAATAQRWAADAQARSAEALASQARQAGHASHIAALNSALTAVTQHVDQFERHVANNPNLAFRLPADVEKARERQVRLRAEIATLTDRLLGMNVFEFESDPGVSDE